MPDRTLPGATPEEPRTEEAKLEEEMAPLESSPEESTTTETKPERQKATGMSLYCYTHHYLLCSFSSKTHTQFQN